MTNLLTPAAIPHRKPFLFADRIVEVSADRIVTEVLADPEAEFFRGHYPGRPIMPGVLICECCFQAGALLIAHRRGAAGGDGRVPVLTRITDARFRRIVRPGETLNVEVNVDDELDGAYFMVGRVTVAGRKILRVSFAATLADDEE